MKAITVDLASKSAVKPVVQLINQIISLLDENQNSVDIAKNDIAIKTDNGAKPELPDMFMAFKARLAAIVNELKTAINGPQSEVDPDFALNLQQTVAPVKSANETDGKESLKSNVDSGSKQNAKTPDAAQTAGVHMPVAQFKAHAAAARQAAPQVNVQNILEQIVQNANLRTGPAGNQMEIQLKPEFLGKLSIVLTSTDEGVVATIKAATAEVRNALSANIAQLQTALRESGINMKDISISNSTLTSDFARSESGARQNPESENEAFNRVTRLGRMLARATSVDRPAESALMYDSSQNLPVISSDMVSVEFSA